MTNNNDKLIKIERCSECGYEADLENAKIKSSIEYFEGYFTCYSCGVDFRRCIVCGGFSCWSNMEETCDGTYICRNCYENEQHGYAFCDDCGPIQNIVFCIEEMHRIDDETLLCDDCFRERSEDD